MVFDESSKSEDRSVLALAEARRLLRPPESADPVWPALAAAALFAICAMILATTAILAPPPSLASPPAATKSSVLDSTPDLRGPA